MANRRSKGFGNDRGGVHLHPKSFDSTRLQLARLGAVEAADLTDDTPDGTVVWEMFSAYRSVLIQAVGETWAIDLTLCHCCPGIKGWEVRDFASAEPCQGVFIQLGSDDWSNAELAIEYARGFSEGDQS